MLLSLDQKSSCNSAREILLVSTLYCSLMKRVYRSLRRFQPYTTWILLCILTFCLLFLQVKEQPTFASLFTSNKPRAEIPEKVQLDSHLTVVSYNAHSYSNNLNTIFRFLFVFYIFTCK